MAVGIRHFMRRIQIHPLKLCDTLSGDFALMDWIITLRAIGFPILLRWPLQHSAKEVSYYLTVMQRVPQETNIGTGITGLTPISPRSGSSWDHFQHRPPPSSVNARADTVPGPNLQRS